MNKTKIEWCDFTFNPVTGCKRGCSYCYARRIHQRFHPGVPFENIDYHPERLADAMPKKPSKIFVGSMSDIEYWPMEVTQKILDVCEVYPRHTFMFLSKSPHSYDGANWPKNCMQGLTLEKCETVNENYSVTLMCKYPRPFLSIEPILGPVYNQTIGKFELVIVGAMTGPGAIPPKPEWVQSVKDNVPKEKLFLKSNILKYWK